MSLSIDFQFSQGSLQDYVDCPRRFQLRYVRRLRWPSIETEPALENERHLRQGAALHQMIRQHLAGVPAENLGRMTTDPELRRWWGNYLRSDLGDLPPQRYPEVRLATLVGTHRLAARYDVIAIHSGREALIVDWKTNRKRPPRAWLSERLQTRVYPYVLVQSGAALEDGTEIRPDRVTMVYWFASFPSGPERFVYDISQCRADGKYLLSLMEEITERIGECGDADLLPPAEDRRRCGICRYRSLCKRGVEPGWLDEAESEMRWDEPFEFSLDFEQIAELDAG